LGEGLPDATIVEWLVKEGDSVKLDAPLVSMETAKAVVEVPSPYTGKVLKFDGAEGDVINTGAPLAEFELDPKGKQRAENAAGGHEPAAPPPVQAKGVGAPAPGGQGKVVASEEGGQIQQAETDGREDEGTVVGAVSSGNEVRSEQAANVGGAKAVPAVRAMARKLKVDLARVTATGADGAVTMQDVKNAAAAGTASLYASNGRGVGGEGSAATVPSSALRAPPIRSISGAGSSPGGRREEQRSTLSQSGKPMRTAPPTVSATGQPEQLKGVRRNMARVMAHAHSAVVPTTLVDDADLHPWLGKQDITARLIRAIVAGCKAVPALNAWFDADNLAVTRHPNVDLGIAVDTEDGLFVPVLRNADLLGAPALREGVNRLRTQVRDRSIPASELTGYTISLSNFGMFAGRYAAPVVVPPCVAIVGAGKLTHDVVAVTGGIEAHRRLPISVTFDHRAATGGEAARFLKAILDDLALPQ
jgi:pyruvate dehydrogenase E2 component (dihydrolipoamide acetyltransferase)